MAGMGTVGWTDAAVAGRFSAGSLATALAGAMDGRGGEEEGESEGEEMEEEESVSGAAWIGGTVVLVWANRSSMLDHSVGVVGVDVGWVGTGRMDVDLVWADVGSVGVSWGDVG